MGKNASDPLAPYIPKEITPFILDNLDLSDVIQYYQIDKASKNSIGKPLDIASLYGLRDKSPGRNLASLNFISNNPKPLAIGRVTNNLPFFLERHYSIATDRRAPGHAGDLAIKCLRQVMPAAVQIFLSLLKHRSLHGEWAKDIMRSVNTILHIACSTVDEELVPDDEQYLIADCVDIIVTIGALYNMDPRASLEHLDTWRKFYISSDAALDLAERKRALEFRGYLSIHASEFLESVLEDIEDPESADD